MGPEKKKKNPVGMYGRGAKNSPKKTSPKILRDDDCDTDDDDYGNTVYKFVRRALLCNRNPLSWWAVCNSIGSN